ncbi:transcription initiation factor TFIID subunit 4 isoform X2 [Teleopsis dalmanni]|uniref:transcription initiation factor TFIID subunit 4 isoform X2 n=1 Tax=Teleopsis dalmanni TaxID=139649 RepID=UPI0018CDEFDB|nr:transcription initiation factor TFIID subunit 4 isoform X2 [Teleopsis dalmanni]
MAASSSAKFFVHQNQNKANNSAVSAFSADSDVAEFIETSENVDKNLGKLLTNNTKSDVNINHKYNVNTSNEDLEHFAFVDIEEKISATTVIVKKPHKTNAVVNDHESHKNATNNIITEEDKNNTKKKSTGKEVNNNLVNSKINLSYTEQPLLLHTYTSNNNQPKNKNEFITPGNFAQNITPEQTFYKSSIEGSTSLPQQQYTSSYTYKQNEGVVNILPQVLHRSVENIHNNNSIKHPQSVMNSSQTTQGAPGNRITFTSQALPNGTINIGGGHPGTGSTIISTSQLPNTTTIKTITSSAAGAHHHGLPQQVQVQHHQVLQTPQHQGQTGHTTAQQQQHNNAQSVGATQTQTLVIKSNHAVSLPAGLVSSAPGIVTMTKTLNQGNQPILNSMIPANVVVGMRPSTTPQQQQKNVQGNPLGRVLINAPHMVTTRPQNPAITLSTLNPGQTPALILKTENGFQLLRVGTASASGPVTQTIGTNSTNPTQIRLQTVPAASMSSTATSNNLVVNSVSTTNSTPHIYTSQANISLQQQQSSVTTSIQHLQQQQIHQQTQHLHAQPQITQVQTIPPQQPHQQQHTNTTNAHNSNSNSNLSAVSAANVTSSTTVSATQNTAAQGNTKEKCRKFLANLIDLSTREPKPVEKNVRNLIQELVNANVEPEEFCDRLERLLNASPQPCLIGFLKKSLPLLRQALFSKELVIEGIKPPPQHVLGAVNPLQQLPKIQAQIRPISQAQTTTIGQTQVRMISPAGVPPRPIGHTTITKQSTVRIQSNATGPRLVNTQIRGALPGTIQQQLPASPQLHTGPTQTSIVQIRGPTTNQITRPATVQIRATKPKNATANLTHVKVGQTQIKAISSSSPAVITTNQPPSLVAISNNISHVSMPSSVSSTILSTINSVANNTMPPYVISGNSLPIPSLPTVQLPPGISNSLESRPDLKLDIKIEKSMPTIPVASKTVNKAASSTTSKAASKKKKELLDKEKDDKSANSGLVSTVAHSSFFQQPSISMSSTLYGEDDINDVAAMGGVNLAEESQRILGCTENIGTQIRSCKDEVFLHLPALQARLRARSLDLGLEESSQEVAVLLSHALQERLKNIIEKLTVITEHRIESLKMDPRFEVSKDVRAQLKFLEELDKAEQKRREELEREMLLRAAKSRSKVEDPEQAKMKARAKEMQRAEMEELRQRDANMTALQAIGPRKKLKLDGDSIGTNVGTGANGGLGTTGNTSAPLRPRIKRVNARDMLFFLESERDTIRSEMLYKLYLK